MKNNLLSTQGFWGLKKRLLVMLAMAGTLVLVAGCFSFQRNISEKKLYSLGTKIVPTVASVHAPLPTLLVKEFDMAPMYMANSFVYRRDEFQFETDYFNEFIIPPQRMITAAVKRALFDARLFSPAFPDKPADHRLQGRINRLYGDFRQPGHPLAVMEISLALDATDEKTFSKETAIKESTPQALVGGWNRLLDEIIQEFVNSLDRNNSGS
ncbi:conserved hypothetical protein [Desulforapulum autotrophicum HRM2]|uniref:ABC-type transport auxiliary lipoprotein component domain-containing protein n=1 Tax=Desulforapulum autotrophicum (strain ATCC 43914 / DSM 3382 / VKM B-1955 / HRM2) TaxID=177437 RepID=C0QIN2_DESAH|nr:hypothetical protein [Desulforapulum autotrophicum]ACN17976.1 conserved hypothetical protein [Desulforapulum autotrophicum HRM2]